MIDRNSDFTVMQVYSGQCCMCDIGIATGSFDMNGEELYTGDIVQVWHGYFIGSDLEEWYPSTGITVIAADQYQSHTDGTISVNSLPFRPYTMGIKDIGVCGEEWKVKLIKSHRMVVDGEKMIDFGINFKKPTDALLKVLGKK